MAVVVVASPGWWFVTYTCLLIICLRHERELKRDLAVLRIDNLNTLLTLLTTSSTVDMKVFALLVQNGD